MAPLSPGNRSCCQWMSQIITPYSPKKLTTVTPTPVRRLTLAVLNTFALTHGRKSTPRCESLEMVRASQSANGLVSITGLFERIRLLRLVFPKISSNGWL